MTFPADESWIQPSWSVSHHPLTVVFCKNVCGSWWQRWPIHSLCICLCVGVAPGCHMTCLRWLWKPTLWLQLQLWMQRHMQLEFKEHCHHAPVSRHYTAPQSHGILLQEEAPWHILLPNASHKQLEGLQHLCKIWEYLVNICQLQVQGFQGMPNQKFWSSVHFLSTNVQKRFQKPVPTSSQHVPKRPIVPPCPTIPISVTKNLSTRGRSKKDLVTIVLGPGRFTEAPLPPFTAEASLPSCHRLSLGHRWKMYHL